MRGPVRRRREALSPHPVGVANTISPLLWTVGTAQGVWLVGGALSHGRCLLGVGHTRLRLVALPLSLTPHPPP